jgi:hypothetical protein
MDKEEFKCNLVELNYLIDYLNIIQDLINHLWNWETNDINDRHWYRYILGESCMIRKEEEEAWIRKNLNVI